MPANDIPQLVARLERSFSFAQMMANACYNLAQPGHEFTERDREVLSGLRANWDSEWETRKAMLAALQSPPPREPAPWVDRFAAMSVTDMIQTIVEDPSTLGALLDEAIRYRTGLVNHAIECPQCQSTAVRAALGTLDGPAGGALVGQTAPTESTGASHVVPDGTYLCACTCGCVDRTIRRGRCMICRVRESCLKERICEACEDGYRLASTGLHYDHNDSTWGVCRKVVASIQRDRERKRARAEYP